MNLVKLKVTKLIHINLLHFYTLTTKDQKEKFQEAIPFTIASKRKKYLEINLPNETKDLYSKDCKMLIKGIRKKHKQMERYTMFVDWKNLHCQNDYTTQGNLKIQLNPCQITNGIFQKARTKKSQNLYGNT